MNDICPKCGEKMELNPIMLGGRCYTCEHCKMAFDMGPIDYIDPATVNANIFMRNKFNFPTVDIEFQNGSKIGYLDGPPVKKLYSKRNVIGIDLGKGDSGCISMASVSSNKKTMNDIREEYGLPRVESSSNKYQKYYDQEIEDNAFYPACTPITSVSPSKTCPRCGRPMLRHILSHGQIWYNCDNCMGPIGEEGVNE